jgi:aspartate dehydrogenase
MLLLSGMRGIGLIGCGAIGRELATAVDEGNVKGMLNVIYDIYRDNVILLLDRLKSKPRIAESIDDIILAEDVDIVVEAASQQAVRDYVKRIIQSRKDVMLMSVGALLDDALYKDIIELLDRYGRRLYLPTGAIAGIDAIKSVRHLLDHVMLVTTKSPRALQGAPFFVERGIDPMSIKSKSVIYEGNAREAVKLFPANVNVAALLSIAGIGADKTIVRIVADPDTDRNTHEIVARGRFGELHVHVSNVPSASNPKTSYLAVLSAVECLRSACDDRLSIGT